VIEDQQRLAKVSITQIWYVTYITVLVLEILNNILDTSVKALNILILVFMLISLALGIWSWIENRSAKHRNLGLLGIYPDHLLVKGNKLEYHTIKNLKFTIGDYTGLRHGNSSSEPGPGRSQGIENFIECIHDGKKIRLQVQIQSKEELLRLHQFLIQLYLSGVDLNERDVFRMAFTDMRYAQIQDLKKQRAENIKEKQRLAQQEA